MYKHILSRLTGQYASLSVIGMCKNAGKTTTLNRLIREFNAEGQALALTSIGRDGETRDVSTSTPKPEIYVHSGTLLATSTDLLSLCDITREIVRTTSMGTPLGDVVILRALSDGFVQLAGPSMKDQLKEVINIFRTLGTDKIIIDGAVSRKSLCSPEVTQATVLCTGASCQKNMNQVIRETVHVCDILRLAPVQEPQLIETAASSFDRLVYMTKDREVVSPEKEHIIDEAALFSTRKDIRWLFVRGAVTDSLVVPLIAAVRADRKFSVVARDGSHVLLSQPVMERMRRRGLELLVCNPVHLAAVTVNPVSVYGYVFNKAEFLEKMARVVPVPVIDVEEETNEYAGL